MSIDMCKGVWVCVLFTDELQSLRTTAHTLWVLRKTEPGLVWFEENSENGEFLCKSALGNAGNSVLASMSYFQKYPVWRQQEESETDPSHSQESVHTHFSLQQHCQKQNLQ